MRNPAAGERFYGYIWDVQRKAVTEKRCPKRRPPLSFCNKMSFSEAGSLVTCLKLAIEAQLLEKFKYRIILLFPGYPQPPTGVSVDTVLSNEDFPPQPEKEDGSE